MGLWTRVQELQVQLQETLDADEAEKLATQENWMKVKSDDAKMQVKAIQKGSNAKERAKQEGDSFAKSKVPETKGFGGRRGRGDSKA